MQSMSRTPDQKLKGQDKCPQNFKGKSDGDSIASRYKSDKVTPEKLSINDEIYESNIDSGFLSGSCISGCSEENALSSDTYDELKIESSTKCCSNKSLRLDSLPVIEKKDIVSPDTESPDDLFREACIPDDDGDIHLHLAIVQGIPDVIKYLIHLKPSRSYLDAVNNLYQTPLHLAVLTNQPKIVRYLVESGSSLEIRDHNGNTPLHLACLFGYFECVKQLTVPLLTGKKSQYIPDLPQDLTIKNYDGHSCLHLATLAANIETIGHLAQYGANVNIQDSKSGWTPLHYSVDALNVKVTQYLLEKCRADPKVQTYKGYSSLQIIGGLVNQKLHCHISAICSLLHKYGGSLQTKYSSDEDSDTDVSSDEF